MRLSITISKRERLYMRHPCTYQYGDIVFRMLVLGIKKKRISMNIRNRYVDNIKPYIMSCIYSKWALYSKTKSCLTSSFYETEMKHGPKIIYFN